MLMGVVCSGCGHHLYCVGGAWGGRGGSRPGGEVCNLFHHGLRIWASSNLGVVITDGHELVLITTASIVGLCRLIWEGEGDGEGKEGEGGGEGKEGEGDGEGKVGDGEGKEGDGEGMGRKRRERGMGRRERGKDVKGGGRNRKGEWRGGGGAVLQKDIPSVTVWSLFKALLLFGTKQKSCKMNIIYRVAPSSSSSSPSPLSAVCPTSSHILLCTTSAVSESLHHMTSLTTPP